MCFNRQFDSDIYPIILDVSKYNLGRYGCRRLLYLKEHHPDVYTTMIFEGTLGRHLEEINEECCNRIYDVTEQLARQEGVDEALKARNQFLWIRKLCRTSAFGTAILGVLALGKEGFHAVSAQMQGLGLVCQRKCKHHLNAQQQGMEIPYKHRLVVKLNMIGRHVAVE